MKAINIILMLSLISLFSLNSKAGTLTGEEPTIPSDSITEVFGDFVNENLIVYPNSEFQNLNLQFNLLKDSRLSCMIYDASGNVIKNIDFGIKSAGNRHIVIPIGDLGKGEYKTQLYSEGLSLTEWFEIP